ncbi:MULTISPECIES: peroxiredoxin [unclassified Thioalkalivibrio]|uniref:peroxiredoxin family protein n=1 Tax=unclassified Thioalkalivibrio TaxID=2621013 RepID=UPI0003692DA7|nr:MULTISPECIES: TlpA disulfide reductase family protein [unclassified Thioalkalivibrio]
MSSFRIDRKTIIGGIFILTLIGVALAIWLADDGMRPAPEFTATTLDGEEVALSDYEGRPVMISFWATNCPSCVREIPKLIYLHETYAEKGFELLAVAVSYDPINRVEAMREDREMPYRVIHDTEDGMSQAFGGVRLTPTTFVISPSGRIVYQKLGDPDFEQIERHLQRWLS